MNRFDFFSHGTCGTLVRFWRTNNRRVYCLDRLSVTSSLASSLALTVSSCTPHWRVAFLELDASGTSGRALTSLNKLQQRPLYHARCSSPPGRGSGVNRRECSGGHKSSRRRLHCSFASARRASKLRAEQNAKSTAAKLSHVALGVRTKSWHV